MTADGPGARRRANHGWTPLVAILAVLVAVTGIALAIVHANDSSRAAGAGCKRPSLTAAVDLRPAVKTDQPDKLKETADILRQRLSAYGCSEVRVDGERLHVSTTAEGVGHLDELTATGELQFREVLETTAAGQCLPTTTIAPADGQLTACAQDGSEQFRLGAAKVVGSDVKGATAQHDEQRGQWLVLIRFTGQGQRVFTDLTAKLVGKRMAIVLDGEVITAPTIQERIDGDAQVTGSFTESSAKALATVLEHGALPVPLLRA